MLPWKCSRRLSPSVTTVRQAIMRMALPIQCMESLFLATYLAAEFKSVRCPHVVASLSVPRLAVAQHVSQMMRLPLSFKSIVAGHTFRHIVLAVEHEVGPRTHLYLPRCLQRGCTRGTGKMGRYWHEPEEDAHAQRLDILGASLQLGGCWWLLEVPAHTMSAWSSHCLSLCASTSTDTKKYGTKSSRCTWGFLSRMTRFAKPGCAGVFCAFVWT